MFFCISIWDWWQYTAPPPPHTHKYWQGILFRQNYSFIVNFNSRSRSRSTRLWITSQHNLNSMCEWQICSACTLLIFWYQTERLLNNWQRLNIVWHICKTLGGGGSWQEIRTVSNHKIQSNVYATFSWKLTIYFWTRLENDFSEQKYTIICISKLEVEF